jgi:GNAT superfamily N-acetyltransferase
MAFDIRPAGPADAEVVHAFIVGLATYERAPDAVEVTVAELRAQLASPAPPFECLLALDAGRPVGFALFFPTYSTWRGRTGIHLEDLFVPEAQRRRGIGTALLARVAQIAVERGCARLEWAVLDWNAPAIAFYRGLGAEALDGWTTYRLTGPALAALAAG